MNEQELQTLAIKTYEKNLSYFEQKHQDTLTKIKVFTSALESGEYKAKYDLEYMGSYFDVKLLHNKKYLYASDSNVTSTQLAKRVDFSKSTYCFDGFTMFHNLEKASDKLMDTQKGILGLYPLMTYYLDNTNSDDSLKKIDKFLFIGAGLGLHIPLIHEKVKAKHYLIIEDDLELFYLSLFCTPYYKIANQSSLVFCIAQDDNSFINNFQLFLNEEWFTNKYLKYSYFPAHSEHKIKLVQHTLASQDFMTFPYRITQDKHLRPLEFINNDYSIINLNQHQKNTIFSKKPVLVIGAGPSLDKHTQWLQKNHKKFIIVAVGSSLRHLHKHNIVPDLVVHLDGFYNSIILYSGFDVKEFLKDSTLLFGSFAPTNVRKLFKKEQCFFLEENTFYFDGFSSRHASCVGSTSLIHTIMFDAKEIYLLGLDFALDSKTGKSHSNSHTTKNQQDLKKKDELLSSMDSQSNLFPIKGNFDKIVYTNPLYQTSLQSLYLLLPYLKDASQKIYNLNFGAHIICTEPMSTLEIPDHSILDKKVIRNEIQCMFLNISSQKLSCGDIASLKKRLEHIKTINKYVFKYKKNASYKSVDKYLYELFGVISDILHLNGERETNNTIGTYLLYFKYTVPIIYDFLNTVGLKNEKYHMKSMDKLFVDEMLYLCETYKDAYEDFLTNKC
ncbi:motility associated factor glycosyltransferase family protein [Sulfurimonas sp. SAG-AH-194-C20]|nr:6-hydroxymethylpterin diphosphokinase MptE-like protein [Sulfurimonas sp. SAG-AH-194-C20]MDF1878198.1 motility associated factor glycosyltransferase family protein [Sulfurimonas sp. SAG-AH-194-C20]